MNRRHAAYSPIMNEEVIAANNHAMHAPSAPTRILHLDDSLRDAMLVSDLLDANGVCCEVSHVMSREPFEQALEQRSHDLILCDFNLPDFDGLAALALARASRPDVPVIIVSGAIEAEEAVKCLKAGATDYLLKQRLERLPSAVQRALEEYQAMKQRRQATEHIRRQARLIDQATDAIFVCDQGMTLTFWNPAATKLYGHTQAEISGDSVLRVIFREPEERINAILEEVLRAGQWHGETRQKNKDGRALVVFCQLTLLTDAQGIPDGILAVNHDLTEANALEQQLLRSQRQEALGALAGGIAHDLNNALAPIMMGVDLLKAKYPGAPGIVDLFDSSVRRAAAMIRQLLTFAKGSEGERSQIQVNYLIQEMGGIVECTFPKNITITVEREKNLPPVLADSTQLHQVLLNLCVNARDAMPSGGSLTLATKKVEIRSVHPGMPPNARVGTFVALQVTDTGTGISAEIRDRIFDPFFSTKTPDKGTGLGLSTVMGIIKGHDGFLEVSSTSGKGTTFTAFLPADTSSAESPPADPKRMSFYGQGETILFVDDETSVREIAREVLERMNFRVVLARDGLEALVWLSENPPVHAVITDLHMPNQDGLSFVGMLRKILPEIPIIVSSGRLEEETENRFRALGVTRFLDKPCDEYQLAEALSRLFAPASIPSSPPVFRSSPKHDSHESSVSMMPLAQ